MAYSTTDEEFSERAYAGAGLQPSVGERATIPLDKSLQLENNVTRVTGVALRKGGGSLKQSGTKMMRAGKTLSRSGAGAVVGAPLMAAGATLRGAGTLNQKAGKGLTDQAKENKQWLRKNGLTGIKKDIKKRVSATRVNMTVLSIATPIWFTLQLPLALGAMFALGIAGMGDVAAQQILGNSVTNFLYGGYDAVTNAIEGISGVNLNIIESWVDFGGILFGALTMLVFLIGMITLFMMAIMYILSGVRCFMGEQATFKMATFIFAMLGYLLPVLNILPWFMLWGVIVWRYPK